LEEQRLLWRGGEGRGGAGERELRPAGALAKGRVGGRPRRGEERRRPLRTGGKGIGSGRHSGNRGEARVGSEERAPTVAHGWGQQAVTVMASGLCGEDKEG
jgi:hypothetical protein